MEEDKPTASTVLTKEEKNLLSAAIRLAGKEGRSIDSIAEKVYSGEMFEGISVMHGMMSQEAMENPPTAEELRECIEGRQLTVTRRENETLSMLLMWLMEQWHGTASFREWQNTMESLQEKLTGEDGTGDQLYEQGAYDEDNVDFMM